MAENTVTQATMSHSVCLYTIWVVSRCFYNVAATDLLAFVFLVEDIVATDRQTRDQWKK